MKYRYTRFTGDALDELDLEDLVAKLSDLLLSSGFGSPYAMDDDERITLRSAASNSSSVAFSSEPLGRTIRSTLRG